MQSEHVIALAIGSRIRAPAQTLIFLDGFVLNSVVFLKSTKSAVDQPDDNQNG